MKKFAVGVLFLLALLTCVGQAQTSFQQSYGPVSSIAGCTALVNIPTSSTISPCGGQGAMFQGSNITVHTVSWVSAAGTGAVSACTLELESSAAGATFVIMTGSVQQTCTSSGSYTFLLVGGANYVKVNLNSLTTTGTASVTITYSGVAQLTPPSAMYVQFCAAGTGGTLNCSNTTGLGGPGRAFGGVSTLASNAQVVTIAPGFSATTTYTCVGNDVTTRANPVQVVPTSATTFTITNTTGASDVINWICVGY